MSDAGGRSGGFPPTVKNGRLALALALAAGAGCGSDPVVAIRVQMALDPDTCNGVAPDLVQLDCDAVVGVWLRVEPGDAILDHACVAVSAGQHTLAELPALLATTNLSTASTSSAYVEVAVYAPWRASDGCPAPEDVDSGTDPSRTIVWGFSEAVALGKSDDNFDVILSCDAIATPGQETDCPELCATDRQDCLAGASVVACDAGRDTCLGGCPAGDDLCEATCQDQHDSCLADTIDGNCELGFQDCTFDCDPGDQECADFCDADRRECLAIDCADEFTDCVDLCGDGEPPQCAQVTGGA